MSEWVIVAIPDEDSPVWRVSSEKAPHLTLLYLGEQELGPNAAAVASYVEHATKTTLGNFGLTVDKRGELGDKNADVLFFEKDCYGIKDVNEFRSHLLKSDLIRSMYESAEQHHDDPNGWTPHLTLGYPDTPAKMDWDDKDYFPISYVGFNKIALWTGDSEGPEFEMKKFRPQFVDGADSGYYHDALTSIAEEFDAIEHYGVKGMKWGVRRSPAELARASGRSSRKERRERREAAKSEDRKAVDEALAKVKKSGSDSLSNSEMQAVVNRMNLEQNYKRLNSNKFKAGEHAAKTAIGVAGTINAAILIANSPAGKLVRNAYRVRNGLEPLPVFDKKKK